LIYFSKEKDFIINGSPEDLIKVSVTNNPVPIPMPVNPKEEAMNRLNGKMKKAVIRILLIILGSAIYWVGYYEFLTRRAGDLFSAGCVFLIVTGLTIAGFNSSYLFRGK
jgi:hypothetical protein